MIVTSLRVTGVCRRVLIYQHRIRLPCLRIPGNVFGSAAQLTYINLCWLAEHG